MPISVPPARGHLRLATLPAESPRPETRLILFLRAVSAAVALFLVSVVAWASGALALAPLLWRRAPVGGRLRPLRAREARIIPFQPRRQQAQQALPR